MWSDHRRVVVRAWRTTPSSCCGGTWHSRFRPSKYFSLSALLLSTALLTCGQEAPKEWDFAGARGGVCGEQDGSGTAARLRCVHIAMKSSLLKVSLATAFWVHKCMGSS